MRIMPNRWIIQFSGAGKHHSRVGNIRYNKKKCSDFGSNRFRTFPEWSNSQQQQKQQQQQRHYLQYNRKRCLVRGRKSFVTRMYKGQLGQTNQQNKRHKPKQTAVRKEVKEREEFYQWHVETAEATEATEAGLFKQLASFPFPVVS